MSLKPALHSLLQWYRQHARVLPWRDQPHPYRVWVSEIMLQQTQVAAVVPYFEAFINRFPDLDSLAAAPVEEVLRSWAGLGYYSRARNLHQTARILSLQEEFPRTRREWESLPGVGPYTAGAILSIAFEQPEAILDANVERVLSRLRCTGGADFKSRLWSYSRIIVRTGFRLGISPRHTNQALMELGALVCQKKPLCRLCPLQSKCRALRRGVISDFPPRRPRKAWVEVEETVICLTDSRGAILVRETPAGSWRAGLWDLPGIGELDLSGQKIGEIQSQAVVTHHRIRRTTLLYRDQGSRLNSSTAARFVHPEQLQTAGPGIGAALKRSLPAIRNSLDAAAQDASMTL